MSDFLSKFTRDQYAEMVKKEEKDKAEREIVEEPAQTRRLPDDIEEEDDVPQEPVTQEPSPLFEDAPDVCQTQDAPQESLLEEEMSVEEVVVPPSSTEKSKRVPPPARHTYADEDTVIDPSYRDKQRKKYIILAAVGVLLLLLVAFGIYRLTHVRMPDFIGKNVSDARLWGTRNRIDFLLEQVYSKDHAVNTIISQSDTQNKMVRKGSTVTLVTSLGADPDEVIPLPAFETFSVDQAREWVEENQANNFSIVNQYSDSVEVGRFISLNIADKNITAETYKRKDTAIAYFSRGPEVFEKNITVPDFTGKPKAEVDTWAGTHSLKLTVDETTSSSIEAGLVISQSVPKGDKIAKNDPFSITVSLGEAVVVPDFHEYNMDNASEAVGVTTIIHTRYDEYIPYGNLISQSILPGTKLSDKDDKTIMVVYSLGLPYLKDLRGTTNEGELQKLFFDEFQSKGANITYTVNYVQSSSPKGTVIYQSTYESLVPLNFNVRLTISLGDGTSDDPSVELPSGKPKD